MTFTAEQTTMTNKAERDSEGETTKEILASIALSLNEIAGSLDTLNANIEALSERFELVSGTYRAGSERYGFIRTSNIE